ncbi:MAG TPA: arsenate reductase (glutaredoxin) [Wenzhouxiangellaceae bacterium]|nr:arsenate reductase (glutaredoxin) [Wenzhouxiangellaceae bacterium]
MKVTVYHNPRCSKSRATLELLQQRGLEPDVVKYLETPPDASELRQLARKLELQPKAFLRTGESAWKAFGLDPEAVNAAELLQLMSEYPILIERPIVVCGERARIGRPPEAVLEIVAGS